MKGDLMAFRLLLFVSLIFLSSCSAIMSGIYGLRNVKSIDKSDIVKYGNQYHVPVDNSFVLDTNYIGFVKSLYGSTNEEQISNHLQPLQAMYFNENGSLISFHVNCYASGFPNLKWNRNQIMEVFPPSQQAPVDSLIRFNNISPHFISYSSKDKLMNNQKKYTVVVFWNRFMGRQSKRFISEIQKNCSLANKNEVELIYVNNDYLFLDK